MARSTISFAVILFVSQFAFAQAPSVASYDAVRVTITFNPDGSRTVYEFDNEHHKAIGTTTEPDGKLRGKIRYEIDETGRFASGVIFGPDDQFRFKSIYKYDAAGRLEQETQLGKDDTLLNKIVYRYDKTGKPTGYSVFDASGKQIRGPSSPTSTPLSSPKSHNALGR